LLEAGDHIHIARKDTNLAVIKPPTGLASSLTLLKTEKKKTKERIAGELQMQIQRRTHTPVIVHVAALPHGFFTPEFNTTAQEGGGGGGKNTGREQGQALRLLKPFTERETERQTEEVLLCRKKKRKGKALLRLSLRRLLLWCVGGFCSSCAEVMILLFCVVCVTKEWGRAQNT